MQYENNSYSFRDVMMNYIMSIILLSCGEDTNDNESENKSIEEQIEQCTDIDQDGVCTEFDCDDSNEQIVMQLF